MRHVAIVLVAAAVLIGSITPILRAEITADEVRAALANGVNHLKRKQKADGTWPGYGAFPDGVTSLCTLALLHAGVGPDDPAVSKALARLRASRLDKTYTVSLQTMVFCKAEPAEDILRIQRNVEWLEQNQIDRGSAKGSWSYPGGPIGRTGDNSNTQFALLALHEAERAGAHVQERTWRLAKAHWESCQNPDGSWDAESHTDDRMYGNAYTTALVLMTLGAPNQLLPIFQR